MSPYLVVTGEFPASYRRQALKYLYEVCAGHIKSWTFMLKCNYLKSLPCHFHVWVFSVCRNKRSKWNKAQVSLMSATKCWTATEWHQTETKNLYAIYAAKCRSLFYCLFSYSKQKRQPETNSENDYFFQRGPQMRDMFCIRYIVSWILRYITLSSWSFSFRSIAWRIYQAQWRSHRQSNIVFF